MDMQKEREAFEEWASNKTEITSLVFSLCFDGEYADTFVQFAWEAWQAAKASAVPDGLKVVPINYECAWCGCTELGGFSDETMIEAVQEQDHESE